MLALVQPLRFQQSMRARQNARITPRSLVLSLPISAS
jgi:hypothetical protein